MSIDLEKLRSISSPRTKGMASVRRLTDQGKVRGFEVSYEDGRTEAVVRPKTIRQKFSVSRQETDD